MGPTVATESFAGRDAETALLRNLVRETVLGHGQCALVEGEPGMGKSALLASVRAEAGELGCQVFAAAADELGQEFPLRAMVDCLRVADDTEDPRRAAICGRLRQECSAGVAGTGEDVVGAAEELLDLVDQACGRRPVLLVLDDLQWADRASLLVWHRLCRSAEQLPLLVLGAYRPVPHRTELDQIRRGVRARGGVVHVLGPLDHCDALRLVAARAGAASCGGELAWLADRAAGNPGYLTELADALLRDDRIRVSAGVAELSAADLGGRVPAALTTAIAGRLDFLSGQALATLRSAALLGDEFSVHDLAVVLHRPASDLLDALGEAVRAGVLAEAGSDLAFRYPLVRQALSDATPLAVRSALHREAAEALAATGAPPVLVARQLLAAADTVDEWTLGWLADTASTVTHRAPRIAVELLNRTVDHLGYDDRRRDMFISRLATALCRAGRNTEAARRARQVISRATEPATVAEMSWVLANALIRTGHGDQALDTLAMALAGDVPAGWRARLRSLTALAQVTEGAHAAASTTAEEAVAAGESTSDRLAVSLALRVLSLVRRAVGDERDGQELVDKALAVLGDDHEHLDLRLLLLADRLVADDSLAGRAEVDRAVGQVRRLAEQVEAGRFTQAHTLITACYFRLGRWDDALAEVEALAPDQEDRYSLLILRGLVALIAGHRDDHTAAEAHLTTIGAERLCSAGDRHNAGYVLLARALAAEREGQLAKARAELAPVLAAGTALEMNVRYLCLPELTRLALAAGDHDTAVAAARTCQAETDLAPTAGRLAAARRCRGLLERTPALLLAAADHYRACGRRLELANTLEDASVLFGEAGDLPAARAAFTEAVDVYTGLGADWDIRRADTRTRPYGIRRGQRGRRDRPTTGWDSLTPTELKVAHLVASGSSNPDIASALFLSRRTVQTHVSHILAKLGAHSRSQIAREAAHHPANAADAPHGSGS